jgi:hypothetical protein
VWLLAAVIGLRATILILNFFSEPNFNFERIDSIGQIAFLGEQVTVVTSAVTGKHPMAGFPSHRFFLPIFHPRRRRDVVAPANSRGQARMALGRWCPVLVAVCSRWCCPQVVIWRIAQLPWS